MQISFSKYQGSGNDFILIDDRALVFPSTDSTLIRRLCHRQFGIGADGLILLQPSNTADIKMRIFNQDGCEAAMCGNGLRCLIRFAYFLGLCTDQLKVETMHDTLYGRIAQNGIVTQIPLLYREYESIDLAVEGKIFPASIVHTGVPHAVIFVDDIEGMDVPFFGRRIREHTALSPEGVNVNFISIHPDGLIRIRTYERGVEAETLSCGTGATAAAYVALKKGLVSNPVCLITTSKEHLIVYCSKESNLELEGPAQLIFHGQIAVTSEEVKFEF
jgi:diaminopimelate epimerase